MDEFSQDDSSSKPRPRRCVTYTLVLFSVLVALAVVAVILGYDADHSILKKISMGTNEFAEEEPALVEEMRKRLAPRELRFTDENELELHQFLHLHQMKTGGTSMDRRLNCAIGRLFKDKGIKVPYGSIHECSTGRYISCRDGKNSNSCNEKLQKAAFMSYCAPVKDLPKFSWDSTKDDIGAITVMRNPVDRVWSMFRFQTKGCYKCMNLTDVYDYIDNGTAADIFGDLCLKQIQNHETANMLSTEWPDDSTGQQLIDQAVYNMKNFFTAIGLTEHLNETAQIFGKIFPWFETEVEWSNTTCSIGHDNKSPQNNRCGEGGTHWDLPDHPDEVTRLAIEDHNQLDIAVYKQVLEHFEIQRLAVLGDN